MTSRNVPDAARLPGIAAIPTDATENSPPPARATEDAASEESDVEPTAVLPKEEDEEDADEADDEARSLAPGKAVPDDDNDDVDKVVEEVLLFPLPMPEAAALNLSKRTCSTRQSVTFRISTERRTHT